MNGNHVVEIVCAVLERVAELVEQKKPTGQSLRQAAEEMREYAKRNQAKPIQNVRLP